MNLSANERARQILEELDDAVRIACDAVRDLFPVGSRIRVKANNMRGWFRLEVTHHGWGRHGCTEVHGVNTVTRKRRRFYVGTDEVIDVELPRRKGSKR